VADFLPIPLFGLLLYRNCSFAHRVHSYEVTLWPIFYHAFTWRSALSLMLLWCFSRASTLLRVCGMCLLYRMFFLLRESVLAHEKY